MPLFQKSVLNKYLKTLDDTKVQTAYDKYTAFFHNETIIQNIKDDKEEQFQYGFLQALFDNVLDYTINPNPDFNLTTEFKNLRGAKKADGAILKDGKAIGVIELKSTKTKDLVSITEQAFGYKNNHTACDYIITSNFEKLRFFIGDAVEFIDFDLFTLSIEQFKLLYLCLQRDQILSGVPLKIKHESTVQEEDITKKLYKDYSAFKKSLFNDMVLNNPEIDKMLLFEKSQKLLDRFLFIFFAEDKGLLPPNSISEILKRYEVLISEDFEKPLYDIFKQYFGYIDKGREKKGKKAAIFGYNGGLFKPDEVLDTIIISDTALINHTKTLTAYDFESEVDVNILGHIFEHSLNEIDEMAAELSGEAIDKSKTKRKKDGVFYTPKYITKYIVDNTLGKLATEKKEALGIKESEFTSNRNTATKKRLLKDLEAYRSYLLSLTICDPACGSGAFLNQALDYLIREHRYIDELQTKLLGGSIILSDITNQILEKNIFGVDINAESVNIARLSLWLRTAQRGRTLTSLNNNIKCGNSLIDKVEIAGEKAFNWENEFPSVFAIGGFDVIIGNPPYVNLYNMSTDDRTYYENSTEFETTYLKYDLYVLFVEKGMQLVKSNGLLSYIIPSVILSVPYGKLLRNKIMRNYQLERIVDFTGFMVFSDAMVESCILGIKKEEYDLKHEIIIQKPKNIIYDFPSNNSFIDQSVFENTDGFQFRIDLDYSSLKVIEKIKKKSVSLESVYYVSKGIVAFSKVDERKKTDFLKEKIVNDKCRKYLEGRDVGRYLIKKVEKYLEYDKDIMSRPTFPELHEQPKILVRAISGGLNATFDNEGYFIDQKLIICSNREMIEPFINSGKRPKTPLLENSHLIDSYSTLGILNSCLSTFYYSKMLKGGVSVLPEDIRQFPIFPHSVNRKPIKRLVKEILQANLKFQSKKTVFISYIQSQYDIEKLPNKLQNWYELEFGDFIKELNKAIKKVKGEKLTKMDEMEWMEVFETKRSEALTLKTEIDEIDSEIDQMVYELYDLTDEEIAIVEADTVK